MLCRPKESAKIMCDASALGELMNGEQFGPKQSNPGGGSPSNSASENPSPGFDQLGPFGAGPGYEMGQLWPTTELLDDNPRRRAETAALSLQLAGKADGYGTSGARSHASCRRRGCSPRGADASSIRRSPSRHDW